MTRRIAGLGVGMMLLFGVLLVQLTNIQAVKAHQYATASNNPNVIRQEYTQPRGEILAADGTTVLAQSVPINLPGVSYKYQRKYPAGSLYAQIVGYDSIFYGLSGVEASYNADLVSHNKPVKTLGDLLNNTRTVQDTVTLTVQPALQQAAARALGGRNGAVVVLDPHSGSVLAMYSNPTFDPNGLASIDEKTANLNWFFDTRPDASGFTALTSLAYQDSFPPGSTFKVVTTSAAYDHAPQLVNKPMPTYSCIPPGTIQGQTTELCNFGDGSCGGTIAVMLPPSCDTGYALLGTLVGAQGMYEEATSFGFDQQPPIDLPHSAFEVSKFPTPQQVQGAKIFLAFSSIGQDYTVASPLQMAMVASAIADNGVLMSPHVMKQVTDSEGDIVSTYKPKPWLTATSSQTAQAVNNLMQQVVQHGTAAGIFPPQDDVAAKTGTAQVGQGNTATTDWMIAFAPANDPKVAIAVVLPNQVLSGTGAAVAGPVMNQMIQAALAP